MQHRHLNHQNFTLAAIDDIIGNGGRRDWSALRRAALEDRNILEDVLRICAASTDEPGAQRYYFWKRYAESHLV
jgi:hypothetical protein